MMSNTPLQFRIAQLADVPAICALVNSAYRGDSSRAGWTTEANLLTGVRVEAPEVNDLISNPDSCILVCQQGDHIVGSLNLQKTDDGAYFGMFAVQPTLQGAGIGKQFMAQAEQTVQARWGVKRMWMTVITTRTELIAYYERRGYSRTGRIVPFPEEVGEEFRLVKDIEMLELAKEF